jgi:hypothetical protein
MLCAYNRFMEQNITLPTDVELQFYLVGNMAPCPPFCHPCAYHNKTQRDVFVTSSSPAGKKVNYSSSFKLLPALQQTIQYKLNHVCWSLPTRKTQFWRRNEEVEKSGSDTNKYSMINSWTYDQFIETRASKEHVITRALNQWGISATFQFTSPGFPIKAFS